MSTVTAEYVNGLAVIYRDIFCVFPELEPARRAGYGLAYGTIFHQLRNKYGPGEITQACVELARGGAVEIKNQMFIQPTELGEEIIAVLTGQKAPRESAVPPFSPPPARH